MLKKIILVRHGEVHNPEGVLYGRTIPVHLSSLGRAQIASVARRITELGLTVSSIHTSTLIRAVETAEILSKVLNVDVIHNEQLVDIHIPALIGKPIAERAKIHAGGGDEYGDEWVQQGHESRNDIVSRMKQAFGSVFATSESDIQIIVSHGDPLTFLLFHLEYPDVKDIPAVGTLIATGFGLRKGHGVVLTIGTNHKVVRKEPLVPDESQT